MLVQSLQFKVSTRKKGGAFFSLFRVRQELYQSSANSDTKDVSGDEMFESF